MRILIYSYNYHPEPNGIAPLITELAEGLVKRGHQVRVVTAMPSYPRRRIYEEYRGKLYLTEQKNGVTIQRSYIRVKPQPNLIDRILFDSSFVLTSFFPSLKGWKPDVIFLTIPPLPACVPAVFLAKLFGCPLVLNVQVILSEAAAKVGILGNSWLLQAFESLEKWAYRQANKISVITDEFTDYLVKQGVPASKIVCIPNWVDVNFIRPLPQQNNSFRHNHNLQEKFVVLYAGNIALTEGLETVIETAVRLKHLPEIVFVIVGEEKALQNLQSYSQNCGADNLKFFPFQPREKLPEMLAAANIGLIMQKRNVTVYNMPSKTPVWLASGRPIIASVPPNSPAARAIQQSQGGVIVPPEEPDSLAKAILDLYANPSKAERLSQQGRQFAMDYYSLEQALNQHEALFSSHSLP
ncbi:MAG: glycosyltransferase family 4 protein [Microcystis aeruginosa G13-05]|nr:glycosyltransferase family 4 protein [Microcystis aeruginosa BK11-02]NCS51679.1 glycosyltransferase family 4 protein [Microcystis aeruginosa G13-05]